MDQKCIELLIYLFVHTCLMATPRSNAMQEHLKIVMIHICLIIVPVNYEFAFGTFIPDVTVVIIKEESHGFEMRACRIT